MDLQVEWLRHSASRVSVLAAGVACAFAFAIVASPAQARRAVAEDPAATVTAAALPVEARQTRATILAGGPFDSSKDGAVFGNRERHLVVKPRGYYREYTVPTPGMRQRGARRIVCGGQRPTLPDACFYTDDHYASFRRIVQ